MNTLEAGDALPAEARAAVLTWAEAQQARSLAQMHEVKRGFCLILNDVSAVQGKGEAQTGVPEHLGAWEWVKTRGSSGEPGLVEMRIVPLALELSDRPQHMVQGPAGPAAQTALCAIRITIWKDLLRADQWK
eukprot:7578588-Alexandrium_andersonii.AAC.1